MKKGRKGHAELRPEVVALVKEFGRKRRKGGPLSLREISSALAERGHLNERGQPFAPTSIANMLEAKLKRAAAAEQEAS
jgi:hypothetical protein